jgi:hypothetical protein
MTRGRVKLAQYSAEGDVQRSIMIAICTTWPGAVVYRRNIGVGVAPNGRVIRFGLPGQADVAAIIDGRAIEIEVKSLRGQQTKEQRNWQAAVERAGGLYILARSVEDTIQKIGSWLCRTTG